MTYIMTIAHDSDSDTQPTVSSLDSPAVLTIEGIDTDRVRVTLCDGADVAAYEAELNADPNVFQFTAA